MLTGRYVVVVTVILFIITYRVTGDWWVAELASYQCEADLPEKLRFGRTDVSCEGWDYAGDSYVLKGKSLFSTGYMPILFFFLITSHTGSCGLEYRLVNTDSSYKLPLCK